MDEKEQNMLYMSELKAKSVCLEVAALLTEIDKDTGYFKQKGVTEDPRTRCNLHYQRNIELVFEGQPRPEGFQQPKKPAVEISVTPSPIQPQVIPPSSEKKYSDVHCIECDRKLTLRELEFINKTGRDEICYQCDKKRKENEESKERE